MGPFNHFGSRVRANSAARYGRGASFLWLATKLHARELISGIQPVVSGTARFDQQAGPFGPAVRFQDSGDLYTLATVDRHRVQSTKFSCFACYRMDTGGSISHTLVDTTGGGGGFSLVSSGTSVSGGVCINSSGVGFSSDANSGNADSWNNCGFGWETGGAYNLLINQTIVSGTLGYNTPAASNTVRLGGPSVNTSTGRGTSLAVVALWPRALPVQELLQLSLDWRELFRPMRFANTDASATSPPPPPSVTLPQLRRGMPRSIGRGFRV